MVRGLVAGKVALVTGGASGIGLATAELLVAEGAAGVVIGDQDGDGARAGATRLDPSGERVLAVDVDVRRSDDAARLVEAAVRTFGRLDVAVNNAGMRGSFVDLADQHDEEWHAIVATNLDGTFYGMRAQIAQMTSQPDGGAIVNISSSAAAVTRPQLSGYVATKTGILGLTRVAAKEYGGRRIRVNAVCPGRTLTPMMRDSMATWGRTEEELSGAIPMGRFARPGELAEAVVWLASDRSSYVTGQVLHVDGGFTT
jgi:NAD(P)-dependent dehydrogenase (short-subunit alcohol dehydrogenase family)